MIDRTRQRRRRFLQVFLKISDDEIVHHFFHAEATILNAEKTQMRSEVIVARKILRSE